MKSGTESMKIVTRLTSSSNKLSLKKANNTDLQSTKSSVYQRKSSRNLLERITNNKQIRPLKLLLTNAKFHNSSKQKEREKQNERSQSKKIIVQTHRPFTTSFIVNQESQKKLELNKQQCCKKQRETIINKSTENPTQLLLKQLRKMMSKTKAKGDDNVNKQDFEQIMIELTGVSYVNVARQLWNEVLQNREVNYSSVFSLLIAIVNPSLDVVTYCQDKPLSMERDEEQFNQQDNRIVLRKMTPRIISNDKCKPSDKIGTFCFEKNCLVFSSSQKQQISVKYNFLKMQIQNNLQQKYKAASDTQRQFQTQIKVKEPYKRVQDITLKVHLKNGLTKIKINKGQDAAEIAKKFAKQQKLQKEMENKLYFFLQKQLQNI